MTIEKDISDRIPFLNYFGMIWVLWYHCSMPYDKIPIISQTDLYWNLVIEEFGTNLGALAMSIFFTTSGFLLFQGLSLKTFGRKLKSRCRTLLLPYLLWQLIYTAKGLLQGTTWSLKSWIGQVFLFRFWPPLSSFWYIYALFTLTLIAPLFLLLFRNKKTGWLLLLLLCAFSHWLYQWFDTQRVGYQIGYIRNIILYLPSYVIGVFFGKFYDPGEKKETSLIYIVFGIIFAMAVNGALEGFLEKMAIQSSAIALLYLLPVKTWMTGKTVYKTTFLTYATHLTMISLFLGRFQSFLAERISYSCMINLLGRLVTVPLILTVSVPLYLLMKKLCPRLLGLLTGGRVS